MLYPSRVSRTSAFVILISFCVFRSCTSQHGNVPNDEGEILYSDSVSIKKMDLRSFPGNATTIVSDLSNAMAIDYHLEKKLVVWTDIREKGIYSTSIDGRGEKKTLFREDIRLPYGLAVDWVHGNIYWTDIGSRSISVATLDGKKRKLLFGAYNIGEPKAIVVNPSEGWMFWTDGRGSPKIERAGMDGSRRSTIVSKGILYPNGLAIDYDKRKLYWVDRSLHSISCSNYDGSNVAKIIVSTRILRHPIYVGVFQDSLYWSDWITLSIFKLKLDTNETSDIEMKPLYPTGIQIYHPSKQPKVTSYCGENNNKCSNGLLCLPTPRGTDAALNYVCACPDGKDCNRIDGRFRTPSIEFIANVTEPDGTLTTDYKTETVTYLNELTEVGTVEYETETTEFESVNTEIETLTYVTITDKTLPFVPTTELHIGEERTRRVEEGGEIYSTVGMISGVTVAFVVGISMVGFCIYKRCQRRNTITSLENPVYQACAENVVINRT